MRLRHVLTTVAGVLGLALFCGADHPTLHPPVKLLDAEGRPVIESGEPVSTMKSCNGCHDAEYIASHSYHADAGQSEIFLPGSKAGRRVWEFSPGLYGRWSPLLYRPATPAPAGGSPGVADADWIRTLGQLHVGGGPAAGSVEMNCFLCHSASPNNTARRAALAAGDFVWAGTATLLGTGIVRREASGWRYDPQAFLPGGEVTAERLGLGEPDSTHCGQCHGQTHFDGQPFKLDLQLANWSTATKGQVFSPQRIDQSGVNLEDKSNRSRPWDVHAASMLQCTSCHFALNDPKAYESSFRGRPEHLRYEPRRLEIGEYLVHPSHQFAKGHTAQGAVARHLDGTMRGCAECHDATAAHGWLPYREVHFERLSCESCHIHQTSAPAVREMDWTLLTPSGSPHATWRGIEGSPDDPTALVTGFRPVLLPREELDGSTRLVPHNLITSSYWIQGDSIPGPVAREDLEAAMLLGDGYHPGVLDALDENGNGEVDPGEAVLDSPSKVDAVRGRLASLGLKDPRIVTEVEAYELHHGVGPARDAVKECTECHSADSRLAAPFALSTRPIAGVSPRLIGEGTVAFAGRIETDRAGELVYRPELERAGLYVLGHSRRKWLGSLGGLVLLGVIAGAGVHTGMRWRVRRGPKADRPTQADVNS